ncbi:hypothetical protein [Shewanella algae]|uniref:hypothetical protein n=1 Tax=Shewanella algae TaxID=38313 RepID=UPI0016429E57|nr:hypothetical protein [Shewanella algae]
MQDNHFLTLLTLSLKYFFFSLSFVFSLRCKINVKLILISILFIILGFYSIDKVKLEIVFGLFALSHIYKNEYTAEDIKVYFSRLNKLMLAVFFIIVTFSFFGIIPSKMYVNPHAAESSFSFIAESKESLGYWNPNVASVIIASVVVLSCILKDRKIFYYSLGLYAVTFPFFLTKLYLPIIVCCVLLFFVEKLKVKSLIQPWAFLSVILAPLIYLLSLCLVFVSEVKFFIDEDAFVVLDVITSFRLSIAQNATEGLSVIELLFGFWEPKDYIDSGLANLSFSIGVLPTMAIICYYINIMWVFYKRQCYGPVFLMLFFLIANLFESLIYFNSVLFIFVLLLLGSGKRAGINRILEATS